MREIASRPKIGIGRQINETQGLVMPQNTSAGRLSHLRTGHTAALIWTLPSCCTGSEAAALVSKRQGEFGPPLSRSLLAGTQPKAGSEKCARQGGSGGVVNSLYCSKGAVVGRTSEAHSRALQSINRHDTHHLGQLGSRRPLACDRPGPVRLARICMHGLPFS